MVEFGGGARAVRFDGQPCVAPPLPGGAGVWLMGRGRSFWPLRVCYEQRGIRHGNITLHSDDSTSALSLTPK